MKINPKGFGSFPRQCAGIVLASAICIPVWAQQAQPAGDSQSAPPAAAQQQPSPEAQSSLNAPKEGFWGHMNPFARKKWVQKRLDPINDRLTELDQVNAKNARDIKDVDARAQAGIQQAQSSADKANQAAMAANTEAQGASSTAQQASGHVDQLNTTVSGIDQYHSITDLDVAFRPGTSVLTSDSRQKLDQLAAGLTGRNGYILEMEAHSPASGSVGIQHSERLADAVKRYLVTEHQIPVYRLHSVALGNAQESTPGDQSSAKPMRIRSSSVHLRLMENSLAAQASASPQSAAVSIGAERP
ncbi:MAG TPA: OmpA family protein [Terracidiphilus sp.]|jgi:outer membrane protein OmpA-like peptidoglycan-associated protein